MTVDLGDVAAMLAASFALGGIVFEHLRINRIEEHRKNVTSFERRVERPIGDALMQVRTVRASVSSLRRAGRSDLADDIANQLTTLSRIADDVANELIRYRNSPAAPMQSMFHLQDAIEILLNSESVDQPACDQFEAVAISYQAELMDLRDKSDPEKT